MRKLLLPFMLFCFMFCKAQTGKGELTKELYDSIMKLLSYTSVDTIDYLPGHDTVKVIMLVCDTASKSSQPYEVAWRYGYSVREKHNTSDGVIDPYACMGCDWHDYWQHLYFLDNKKKLLSANVIVWQSKEIE